MKRVKSPSVAGSFYSSDKHELAAEIASFVRKSNSEYECDSRAVIAPHAGYFYSGQLACDVIQYLNPKTKTVIIIAPCHRVYEKSLVVSSYDVFFTPLGEVLTDKNVTEAIVDNLGAKVFDKAFDGEHAIEVQIPFIQTFLPDAKIVPVLLGDSEYKDIYSLIEYFWDDEGVSFVISSDLSHFYHDTEAQKIDSLTAEMIETGNIGDFNPKQACGASGIIGLVNFAVSRGFSMIRVDLQNSSAVSEDKLRVVGYGSWLLYEGTKEKFLKDNFSDVILDICRKSIKNGLKKRKPLEVEPCSFAHVLQQKGACFVTLEIDDVLRGCIGSIIEHQPLVIDLSQNAFGSAFSDSRFSPLQDFEYELLSVSVSLLSAPSQMVFEDERDLLEQIVPNEDGIIIRDGYHQAVYLPVVWEQLPDKVTFLNSLKQKAGLRADHFSSNFEAYRFRTEYIKEAK
ncbi:MAG: AmmeMemoRadiSam system protein B [Candidatus Gastranaerophilales bacterium]|nr:AmmeMemoRadiSam system protein B [Candidatus Gastranaerophilales bacterium]